MLRIGIDFDNTIVDYRPLLGGAKAAVRDRLRERGEGEAEWQRLQAELYGVAIASAPPFEGFELFLREARRRDAVLFVVSHKSRFAAAAPEGPDLREAATRWLAAHGFTFDGVYFEDDRASKLARLESLRLSHFIDDLEDVLTDPAFPAETRGIHFRDSWESVLRDVFG